VTNWKNFGVQTEKKKIVGLYGMIKGQTARELFRLNNPDDPSEPYLDKNFSLSQFFKSFIESMFLTFRVNQKEYLEKLPAALIPAPFAPSSTMEATRPVEEGSGYWYQGAQNSHGITGMKKSGYDNGLNLRQGIDICRGDVFDVRYQLDGLDRTFHVLNDVCANIQGMPNQDASFSFHYDLNLIVNTVREVQ
jgi:hypothetical protein